MNLLLVQRVKIVHSALPKILGIYLEFLVVLHQVPLWLWQLESYQQLLVLIQVGVFANQRVCAESYDLSQVMGEILATES